MVFCLELFVYFVGAFFLCLFVCFKQLRNIFTSLVHFCIFYDYMKVDITHSLKLTTHLLFHSPSTPLQRNKREIRQPKVRKVNGQGSLTGEEIKRKK